MPTSVALGEHFENFVKRKLAEGQYNNASEVVRAGLRLLEDAEAEKALRLKALRAAVKAGLDSGAGHDADAVFDRLEAKYQAANARG
ncbi:type II toxin-antitoxin system ParD family antitoxin [Dokdonella soli]|uniref:Antitoxin ParD n=1 Tax=Dokdonella soli TaxID=529810 RepID=A0ABN1IWA4_9GAMM